MYLAFTTIRSKSVCNSSLHPPDMLADIQNTSSLHLKILPGAVNWHLYRQCSLYLSNRVHRFWCGVAYIKSMIDTNVKHYSGIILDSALNQVALFSLVAKLLQNSTSAPLRAHESPIEPSNLMLHIRHESLI